MKRLIKLEFRNLIKQKSFLICLIISSALIIIGILASNFINDMAKKAGEETLLLGVNAFDNIIGYLAGGNMSLLLAIVISIYFGSEASDGTIKNIIAKGYSRGQFLIAKLISIVLGTIIFILISFIINYIMCFIVGIDMGTFTINNLIKLSGISLALIAEVVMFGSISFIIFKTSANIVANICIPLLLPLVLALADVLLKTKTTISNFWIESTSSLIIQSTDKIGFVLLVSIGYIVVFTILGINLTKRKEIK